MRFSLPIAATAALLSSAASAALISGAGSLAGANNITLPAANFVGAGPQSLGPITWTSDFAASRYGWTGGADFGSNGNWAPGGAPILGLNTGFNPNTGGYANMTLTFDNPVSGFLAEVNWALGGTNAASVIIQAFDVNGNRLTHPEFPTTSDFHYYWFLANNGNSNVMQPGYYGFTFANPVIKSVVFSNGFIAVRNLSWTGPAVPGGGVGGVPEPASWAMLIVGFGLVGAMQRRRGAVRVSA
ncbi:PEPxxWA-CTERM sorting domain-containing protein [Sandarakinorhabdus sp. AAP62]|uniref:PEPxxWA-CTERM sorting domain-containing protein n=1 Tax=Sandarakinorhabdus sp. AAP62 TaxID=1248916 RepID=UPI0002D3282E|nr:PEPxxWA-CTERM sorting domain-containing protein [Sandarakinorhabdus sp. AAP62]